jgi:hypothetical protein
VRTFGGGPGPAAEFGPFTRPHGYRQDPHLGRRGGHHDRQKPHQGRFEDRLVRGRIFAALAGERKVDRQDGVLLGDADQDN